MWWDRLDKFLIKVEKKGFNAANRLHIWTINIILCGLAYGTYTFFRDYNEFFLDARVFIIFIPSLIFLKIKRLLPMKMN